MQKLYLLDVSQGPLPALLLTAAALANPDADVLLLDGPQDAAVAVRARERFHPAWVGGMPETGADHLLPSSIPEVLAYLASEELPEARGVVLAPIHSPSWMVKGAALATRLGYLLWPLEESAGLAQIAGPNLDLIVVGEAPGALVEQFAGRTWQHLSGDRALAVFLQERVGVDNLVLINTADLQPPGYSGEGLAAHWTPGLSLLAPQLAAFRNALVLDARSPRPDGKALEASVAQKLADTGLRPHYFTILASPGAVPFVVDVNPAFGDRIEHYVRDLHLRTNDDLFFDVAEGRIFATSLGWTSLNLLTVRRWDLVQGSFRQRATLAARPHLEGRVSYAVDEAVARLQLAPVWERLGLQTRELYDRQCTPELIAGRLTDSVLTLYAGHGGPEGWFTHGQLLTASDLPEAVAPGIVCACASSTANPHGYLVSDDGGHSHSSITVPPFEAIGPALINRGTLVYVGGLTMEDVLYNTPMYVAFSQALLLKGQSVGEAVQAARNYALTLAGVLAQTAPQALESSRLGLAATIGQQVLLGDPAFVPFPAGSLKAASGVRCCREEVAQEDAISVQVALPAEAWRQAEIPVGADIWSRTFYGADRFDALLPVCEDVLCWGHHYTAMPNAARGVMGGWVRLSTQLPAGRVPLRLILTDAQGESAACLVCDGAQEQAVDAVAALQRFVVPLGVEGAPVVLAQKDGWAFTTEETDEGLRIHWLVPALVIDPVTQQVLRLKSVGFRLVHTPGQRVEGRLQATGTLPADLLVTVGTMAPEGLSQSELPVNAAKPGPQLSGVTQVLAQAGGRFVAHVPTHCGLAVRVQSPLPVYQHALGGCPGLPEDAVTGLHAADGLLTVSLPMQGKAVLRGVVIDASSSEALDGAVVRLWQGQPGMERAYVGETTSDHQGRFSFAVPAGEYTVAVVAKFDLRYLPAKERVTLYAGQTAYSVVGLQPGALVTGRVEYAGGRTPSFADVRVLAHEGQDERAIALGFVGPNGQMRALVPAGRPFGIQFCVEGYEPLYDNNEGRGFALQPGAELSRSYMLRATSGQ